MVPAMDDRLTRTAWIEHGLRTLAATGPGGLKVGALSAGLNVSRGSFYWHFRDIAHFKAELLTSWRERATDQVIRDLEADRGEPDRLKHLLKRAFSERTALDRAVRSWAESDKDVEAVVAAIDVQRVDYVAGLIEASGIGRRTARSRATFVYWAYLGQAVAVGSRLSIAPSAIDDLSELLEMQSRSTSRGYHAEVG
jgi:AcrR family transcriptional regulator